MGGGGYHLDYSVAVKRPLLVIGGHGFMCSLGLCVSISISCDKLGRNIYEKEGEGVT